MQLLAKTFKGLEDVLAVAAIVLGLGFLAAWYATRSLHAKEDTLVNHNS